MATPIFTGHVTHPLWGWKKCEKYNKVRAGNIEAKIHRSIPKHPV